MYQYEGKTFAEEEDLCMTCDAATNAKRLCPLMKSFGTNEVCICGGSMIIEECDFFIPRDEED